MTSVTHPIELSIVRQFSSNEDVELATRCIATISEVFIDLPLVVPGLLNFLKIPRIERIRP